jgi:hypothetical protein
MPPRSPVQQTVLARVVLTYPFPFLRVHPAEVQDHRIHRWCFVVIRGANHAERAVHQDVENRLRKSCSFPLQTIQTQKSLSGPRGFGGLSFS